MIRWTRDTAHNQTLGDRLERKPGSHLDDLALGDPPLKGCNQFEFFSAASTIETGAALF